MTIIIYNVKQNPEKLEKVEMRFHRDLFEGFEAMNLPSEIEENHKDTKSTKTLIDSLCSLCLCGLFSHFSEKPRHSKKIISKIFDASALIVNTASAFLSARNGG